MTIDLHKVIIGNPISKNLLRPWGSNSKTNSLRRRLFNKFTGPGNPVQSQVDFNPVQSQVDFNPVQSQVDFNPYTGQIYKVNDPPSSRNDRCSILHDIKYTVAENIGRDSKDIKKEN